MREQSFLFLGYGLRDWNVRVLLRKLAHARGRTERIRSWAIVRHPGLAEQVLWSAQNVEMHDVDLDAFVSGLEAFCDEPIGGQPDSPYVGLAPFEAAHADYFFRSLVRFGRSRRQRHRPADYGALRRQRGREELSAERRAAASAEGSWRAPRLPRVESGTSRESSRSGSRMQSRPRVPSTGTRVVILDQFEEFFLYADAEQVKGLPRVGDVGHSEGFRSTPAVCFSRRRPPPSRRAPYGSATLLDTTLELRHLDELSVREAIERPIAVWN